MSIDDQFHAVLSRHGSGGDHRILISERMDFYDLLSVVVGSQRLVDIFRCGISL